MTLGALFDSSLVDRATRPALSYPDARGALRAATFGEVDARANRMAHELDARGFTRGDRLCVQLQNRVEFIDLFLACTRLGVIFVPINALYKEREVGHIVRDAEPRAVVIAGDAGPAYPSTAATVAVDELNESAARHPATRLPIALSGDSPAMIVYTSGTTGAAKGAVHTHGSLAANGTSVVASWRISESDRYLAMLPLFHVHGLGNGLHAWLISGCLMRLEERFDYRSVAAVFREFQPTLLFGVPTMYVRMLDPAVISDADAREIGARARLFVSGSAPLPAHVHEAFHRRFGHTILERYGMTEALMITTNPYDGERRAGSVGHPFPGVALRLIDGAGRDAPEGVVAELCLRSPHLFSGYWRNQEATEAAFVDGYFRSGDLAERSSDGYYTLRGRRGDLIISGGFNIYPREIEELLLEDPRIREAAVIGVPDALRGEVPVAYIVADDALDVAELDASCRRQLASFKVPRQFHRTDSLPRTALGKLQKHLLPRLGES